MQITVYLTKKNYNMKTFRVIYLPHGREDKEWIDVEAVSKEAAINNFRSGIILRVE